MMVLLHSNRMEKKSATFVLASQASATWHGHITLPFTMSNSLSA